LVEKILDLKIKYFSILPTFLHFIVVYTITYILVILNKLSSGVPPSFSRGSFYYTIITPKTKKIAANSSTKIIFFINHSLLFKLPLHFIFKLILKTYLIIYQLL